MAERKQITTKEYLAEVKNGLEHELSLNAKALPENFNQSRFVLNCISLIKSNLGNYNNITPESVYLALAKGAYLGLDFFNGECYAIPYSGEVNFQTDYKGEIKLAKTYSRNPIKDIYAKNVRKGDFFEEIIESGKQSVNFRPVPFSDEPIIGTFAVVLFKDGSMMYDTMSVAEIEQIRNNFSKAKNSKAYNNPDVEGETRMIRKPQFKHKCASTIKINDEKSGSFNNEMELDMNENGCYYLKPVADTTQRTIFDSDFQSGMNKPESDKEDDSDIIDGTFKELPGNSTPALPCNDDSGSKDESDAPAEGKDSTENAPDSPETDENGTDNISSADEDNDAEIDATEALFGTDGNGKEDSDEPSDDYGYDDPEEE